MTASFLRADAGAFIGSLWEVVDISACADAQEFYRAALGARTLGSLRARRATPSATTPSTPPGSSRPLYHDPAAAAALASHR
jgi:hypothetical protein